MRKLKQILEGALLMILLVVAVIVLFGYASSRDAGLVERTLVSAGYTDIQTGATWLGDCTDGEMPTSFTALKDGIQVKGVVCVRAITQTAYIRVR